MLIAIRERGLGLSSDGRAYAIDRVESVLHSVERHVRKVTVYLSDENGPRGGADKRCLVRVELDTGAPLAVESRGETVTSAVDDAAGRVGHVVHNTLHRRLDVRRRIGKLAALFGRVFKKRRKK